jgi:hypothetical protein
MSIDALNDELEQDRQQLLDEMAEENDPNWGKRFEPGSFGCHELLDRTAIAADHVERFVQTHPACALNPEWYALAEQAAAALRQLYQQIGAAHLDEQHKTNGTA